MIELEINFGSEIGMDKMREIPKNLEIIFYQ
jgi:hypothetical protein